VTVEARPTHFVTCSRLINWRWCCSSCHEDENAGYDNLYWENVEVAPKVSVGVHTCCAASDRVYERVRKMTARLGGSGRRW
jgi:hypothetical protein